MSPERREKAVEEWQCIPTLPKVRGDTAKEGPLSRRKRHLMACIPDCELLQGMNTALIVLDSLYKVLVDTGKHLVILCVVLPLM